MNRLHTFLTKLNAFMDFVVGFAILIGVFIVWLFFVGAYANTNHNSAVIGIVGGIIAITSIWVSVVLGRREYYKKNGINPKTKNKL